MIKLYNTYNKVKNVFKKPKLKFSFRQWKYSNLLPVWRRGNFIHLGKYYEYETEYNYANLVDSKWNDLGKRNHPILSKFFKPVYKLPLWLSFYIFNHDVIWKTKYDDYRYEYPPQFTIVIFGWSFNWWLIAPTNNVYDNDNYWESILWYLDTHSLDETDKNMGVIIENFGEPNEIKTRAFDRNKFLKSKFHSREE